MPLSRDEFAQQLTASGLLDAASVAESLSSLPLERQPADGEALARELVRQKKLTKFQAEQLYAGKGKSLTLGNYVILDKLGQGGMGMVLKAEHKRMKRLVALKVMSPTAVKTPDALKRFHREVEAAAKLTHPNIVNAFDADEAKGTHFLVMEYVEGTDLSVLVKKHGPLPVEQAVRCIIQAARGLEFAHEQGVIHRDIKPANLLIDAKGTVKILDMGLARIEGAVGRSSEGAGLTSTGTIMGTVDYMSPEQAMDTKHADARSDIYSLGCSLYYLLAGKCVYDGDTMMKKLMAHQNAPIPSLSDALANGGRQLPGSSIGNNADGETNAPGGLRPPFAELQAVFRRMVAKRPEDRPQTMTQVMAELERCLSGGSPTIAIEPNSNMTTSGLSAGSGNELQDFLRQISGGESSTATSAAPSGSKGTVAAPSSGEAETMISSAGEGGTDPRTDQSLTLERSGEPRGVSPRTVRGLTPSGSPSGQRKKVLLLSSVAVAVLVLLAIVFAIRGKSGTLHLEITDDLTEVTIGDTSHVVKGVAVEDVRLPLGEHVLHIQREDLAFDTNPFEVTKGENVPIKVERVGRRVRAMQGKTLLGHKESPKGKLPSESKSATANDYALRFDDGHTVRVESLKFDPKKSLTIEASIKIEEQSDKDIDVLSLGGLRLFCERGHSWSLRVDGKPNRWSANSAKPWIGQRVHVAFVKVGAQTRLFVDGKLVSSGSGGYGSDDTSGGLTLGGAGPVVLDEVRISTTSRYTGPKSDVQEFTPPSRLEADADTLALYHFDEGQGDKLVDSSGNNYHGKIVGAQWVRADGAAISETPATGYAMQFSGPGHRVDFPTLKLNPKSSHTLEAYVTPAQDKVADRGWANMVRGPGLTIQMTADNRCGFHVQWLQKDGQRAAFSTSGIVLPKGNRTHVAGVQTEGEIRYYVDGKFMKAAKPSGTELATNSESASLGGGSGPGNFEGVIDEVRFSKVARYEKDFMPSIRFENDPQTLVLYHFDEGTGDVLNDSSGNNYHGKISGAKWVRADGGPVASDEPDRRAAKWAMSIGGNITIMENGQERSVGEVKNLPLTAFEFTKFGFDRNPKVTDSGLANFKGCKNLTSISFVVVPVSDTGLAHFKDCNRLTSLSLSSTQVSDVGLAYFADCKHLKVLNLWNTQVSDVGLVHFKDCRQLTFLGLNRTQVSDAGLDYFKNCQNLTTLYLDSTRVSDAGLVHFKDCQNLTTLTLGYTQVSDAGLIHFKNLRDLAVLQLEKTQVTDAGLQSLTGLANLKHLVITGTKVTETGVKKLSAALPNCKIDWDGEKLPFVTLRNGAEAARHATLEEALEASQSQDVIEVHGNGPFPIGGPKSVTIRKKEFTLKAAPGFRPLFVSAPSAASDLSSLFYFYKCTARFEGIDFVSAGPTLCEFNDNHDSAFLRCRFAITSNGQSRLFGFSSASEQKLSFTDCCLLALNTTTSPLNFVGGPAKIEMSNTLLLSRYPALSFDASGHALRMNRCTVVGQAVTQWSLIKNQPDRRVPGIVEPSRCLLLGSALILNDSKLSLTEDVRWQGKDNVYGLSPNGDSGIQIANRVKQTFDEWVNSSAKPETGSKLVPTKAKPLAEFQNPDPAVVFRKLQTYLEELRTLHPDVGADPAVAEGASSASRSQEESAVQLDPNGRIDIPLTLPANSAITYEFEVTRKPPDPTNLHHQLAMLVRGSDLKQFQDKFTLSFNSSPRFSINALIGRERFLLAATVTGTKLRLFINGRQVSEGSPPAPVSISDLNSVYLGLSPGAPPNFRAYDAPLHRFRLSRGERYSADYDPAGEWLPDEQTLVLYDFRRGGTADQVLDLSANKKHGKLVNAKWNSAIGSANSPKLAPESSEVGRVHDLLKLVDVHRDAGVGNWKRVGDGVACENPAGANVLQLPYEPPEEYDFEIEFTTTGSGLNVNQYVAASGQMFAWKLNSHNVTPPLYGFELLDGKFAKENKEAATQIPTPIKDGQRYRSTIEVRRGSLRTLLDGQELVKWTGDFKRLSMESATPMKHPGRIGIGSWRRPVTFHSATVREVSGAGKLMAAETAWLDVLPLIDPQRDRLAYPMLTGANDWSMANGELIYKGDPKGGNLIFPVRIEGPNVELECELTRTNGSSHLNINLPSKKGPLLVEISQSGGNVLLGWPSAQVGKFSQKTGQRTKYLCKIAKVGDKDVLDVYADGASIAHWEGDRHSIGKPDPTNFPQATSSGFYIHPRSDWTFHRVRIRAPGGSVEPTHRSPVTSAGSPWTDWLGPQVKRGWFQGGGWSREGDAVTTDQEIVGTDVLPTKTRDGAVRVTYLLRGSKGLQLSAREHTTEGKRDFAYFAEDNGKIIQIAQTGEGLSFKTLAKQVLPEGISKDAPRTLEFRAVGETLTLTLNDSVTVTVKDAVKSDGLFAVAATKKLLIQKVEVQRLDDPAGGAPKP